MIESLNTLKSLEELQLHFTGIGVKECKALSELLSSSTCLKFLDITSLRINDDDSEDDAVLLSNAVELIISKLSCTELVTLVMIFPHFSVENAISLASVLKTNCTLVELNLAQCNINSVGACNLASALHENRT